MLVEEHHAHQARNRGRHRVDPHQQRLVGGRTTDHRVRLDRQKQRYGQGQERDKQREDDREVADTGIFTGLQNVPVVVQAHEGRAETERVLKIEGRLDRLYRRPVEKDQDDGDLRQQEEIRQGSAGELDAFHVHAFTFPDGNSGHTDREEPSSRSAFFNRSGQPAVLAKRSSSLLPSSSMVLKASSTEVSLAKILLNSRSMTSRICG